MSIQTKRIESETESQWGFLEPRIDTWRKQLYLKDSRLRASTVWMSMLANGYTLEQTAENWDLPIQAVMECIRYSESHEGLLADESEEERRSLEAAGYTIEPPPTC